MSTNDKTRQQLVDSMRKTKDAAAGTTAPRSKAQRPVTQTAKSVKKTSATPVRKRSVKVKDESPPVTRDSYQVGRRVWPD